MITNLRSDINGTQKSQPSRFKTNRFVGVHASNSNDSDSETKDGPLRALEMNDFQLNHYTKVS